jgi:arginyl-tRNA synthetase
MTILDIYLRLKSVPPTSLWTWTVPPTPDKGILTTNQAFLAAKNSEPKQSPIQLVNSLQTQLNQVIQDQHLPILSRVDGPYLNIFLNPEATGSIIFDQGSLFSLPKLNQTILIDFFNPNVGKKMHVGHIRSANIGEAMRRILSLKYDLVISNNHLGDWGIQFSYLIWGLNNFDRLNLAFPKPNLLQIHSPSLAEPSQIVEQLYQIYVRVNQMVETEEDIKQTCKEQMEFLEKGMIAQGQFETREEAQRYLEIYTLYDLIVRLSLQNYQKAAEFLNLNQIYSLDQPNRQRPVHHLSGPGIWVNHPQPVNHQFDLIVGESFYIKYTPLFDKLVTAGIAIKDPDSKAIYVDLENQNLGRCYLISSEGYSLYHSRDILARFIWAGVLGANLMLSFADNRQQHSFQQVFAVIKLILESKIFERDNFGDLNRQQTDQALRILAQETAKLVSFGFMTLPDGAMSTRKGKIVAFEELQKDLETKVREVLSQKTQAEVTDDLVRKVAVATLKWVDLFRDRDQDVVFDLNQFLKFEGNTGVYQLYTVARINSILEKNADFIDQINKLNQPDQLPTQNFAIHTLKTEELEILQIMHQLPLILDQITTNYKPHLLCTHLFNLATKFNTWYAKPENSITKEVDLYRKIALIQLIISLKEHFTHVLELLGIETVEKL